MRAISWVADSMQDSSREMFLIVGTRLITGTGVADMWDYDYKTIYCGTPEDAYNAANVRMGFLQHRVLTVPPVVIDLSEDDIHRLNHLDPDIVERLFHRALTEGKYA